MGIFWPLSMRNVRDRWRTRDIEWVLEWGGDVPVYGPNLRASCRCMEAAGWLHTLRAPNLQLAVELTDAGRELAAPLLAAEQERELAERRATEIRVLPLVPIRPVDTGDSRAGDRPVRLDDIWYMACRGDYVIRADGTQYRRVRDNYPEVQQATNVLSALPTKKPETNDDIGRKIM